MDLYLMSPPHPEWRLVGRSNFRSKEAPEVDATKARLEWLALAEAIEALGGTVAVLPPERELTGMPFAAEAGHALPPREAGGRWRFLLPRMKHDHRKGERELWKPFVEKLGFEAIDIGAGTWEGQGDVATFGGTTFLFYGGRTNQEGALAAREHFGGETFLVEVEPPAFHGNMAVLPLDRVRTAFLCADALEDNSLAVVESKIGRDRTHLVSEAEIQLYATNALPVGPTLLAPSIMPARTQKLAERDGMKVNLLEMKELCEKAGGASRCLVCRISGLPDDFVVPEEHRLTTTRALIRG